MAEITSIGGLKAARALVIVAPAGVAICLKSNGTISPRGSTDPRPRNGKD